MKVKCIIIHPKYYLYMMTDSEFRHHVQEIRRRMWNEKDKDIKNFWKWRLEFLKLHPETFRGK